MQLTGRQLPFGGGAPRLSGWRLAAYVVAIAGLLLLARGLRSGTVTNPLLPPPTPTRNAQSYSDEAEAHFSAGNLERAVSALQSAVAVEPDSAQRLAELARVQTYYSSLSPNLELRQQRLAQARESIDQAVSIDPDSSYAQAIRALVYDWSASAADEVSQQEQYLTEAEGAATRALQLESAGTTAYSLALAFSAEVLIDQQRPAEAEDRAAQAAAQAPDLMDVRRVYGTVLQATGQYRASIDEFLAATEINPNLTFLYLQIGANYRRLRDVQNALDYFDRAVRINEQNSVSDPLPYLSIARTYIQQGEFFVAARNVERALGIDVANAETWGLLGMVYYRARNYESSLEVLHCAVDGCDEEEARRLLCQFVFGCDPEDPEDTVAAGLTRPVTGLALRDDTLEYYYTYDSVLAYYGLCEESDRISRDLMTSFGTDAVVAGIVADNRSLCSPVSATGTPEAGGTGTPEARGAATPTP
jgi:tetratricopeptide (TPR) repeat protein